MIPTAQNELIEKLAEIQREVLLSSMHRADGPSAKPGCSVGDGRCVRTLPKSSVLQTRLSHA